MNYKTIVFQQLRSCESFFESLQQRNRLVETMDLLAAELKQTHHQIIQYDKESNPNISIMQLSNDSLSTALRHLDETLGVLLALDDTESGQP